jgi:hypothetical protein
MLDPDLNGQRKGMTGPVDHWQVDDIKETLKSFLKRWRASTRRGPRTVQSSASSSDGRGPLLEAVEVFTLDAAVHGGNPPVADRG